MRVLLWAGFAGAGFLADSKDRARSPGRTDRGHPKIRCGLDAREHPIHCHHEKIVVVDDEIAFVGGIDLTELGGDRFDHSHHPHREDLGWHDVSSRLRGPIVGDVAEHFALRWKEVTGEKLAAELGGDTRPARASRRCSSSGPIPQGIYERVPQGDYRILEAYVRALRSAERLIYIENQFLWSPEIIEILCGKLANPPSEEFRIVVLLPVRAQQRRGCHTRAGRRAGRESMAAPGVFVACSIYAQERIQEIRGRSTSTARSASSTTSG